MIGAIISDKILHFSCVITSGCLSSMCICAAEKQTSLSSTTGHRSQNPFSGLFWEESEKHIGVTNIWPGDKLSGGKWHYITQRETNPICHFRSTASREEEEGRWYTRGGSLSLCRLCRRLAMHSNSWALWLICPKAVIYSFVRDPGEPHNGFYTVCIQRQHAFPLGLT